MKFYLKGKSSEKPNLLMAHYDVVPVTDGWDHDPFLGEVVDGYLYGRGTLDTKNTMACALSALERALLKGYIPNNDLYLCFGANEEIYGDAQVKVVEEFKKQGIKFNLVFDEGGGILKNAFPGVKEEFCFRFFLIQFIFIIVSYNTCKYIGKLYCWGNSGTDKQGHFKNMVEGTPKFRFE